MGMLRADPRPTVASDQSLGAKQEFKDSCNINNIMRKYRMGGTAAVLNQREGQFADLSAAPADYRTAVQQATAARQVFMQLSADTRAVFDNNPAAMLDALADPAANREVLEASGLLGLATRPPVTPPDQPPSQPATDEPGLVTPPDP